MKLSFKTLCSACLLSLFLITISGCGKSVSGTYAGQGVSVEFKDGSKATVTILGTPVDATYAIDGTKLTPAGGGTPPLVFTIVDDNSITGADGVTLKKK